MADRLSPCVLSLRFALCSSSDYIFLPVCVRICLCSSVCMCTQLGSSFRVSPSFEYLGEYYPVNHEDFIALPELICLYTGTCLFIYSDYSRRLEADLCVCLHLLGLHILVCLYLCERICVF